MTLMGHTLPTTALIEQKQADIKSAFSYSYKDDDIAQVGHDVIFQISPFSTLASMFAYLETPHIY